MICRRHCWVWCVEDLSDQVFAIGCAHCDGTRRVWISVDFAGDVERTAVSLAAHGAACIRPARLPVLASLGA